MSKKIKTPKKNKRHRTPTKPEIEQRFAAAIHYCQSGLLGQAQIKLGENLAEAPHHLDSYKLLAEIATKTGQAEVAILILERTVEQHPHNRICRGYLADLLSQSGRFAEATPHYEKEIALSAKNPKSSLDSLLLNTAKAYYNSGNPLQAVDKLKQAIQKNSKNLVAHYTLASIYQATGDIENAKIHALYSLDIDPLYPKSLYLLSTIDVSYFDKDIIEKIKAETCSEKTLVEDRIYLSFSLSTIFELDKEFDQSFKFLELGNKLKKQSTPYNFDKQASYFRNSRRILSRFLPLDCTSLSSPITPIFIVGMPRSGTTLIEQIIVSHEEVTAGGEMPFMDQIARSIMNEIYSKTPPDEEAVITNDNLKKYHSLYLAGISNLLNEKKKFITDKMPQNFFYLGLIKSLFPTAKIVHIMRNPLATAFSCYKTFFTEKGQEFTNDLEDLGKFYLLYLDTIAYWKKIIPESILDVQYEDLVSDQEKETRRILDFCGLQWDNRCLDFHKTARTVSTASVLQVRKPIYKSSLAMWKKYEKHLEPLINHLGGELTTR